jgi:hypothetical protein
MARDTEKPVHDHANHAADALRTLGIAHRARLLDQSIIRIDLRRR